MLSIFHLLALQRSLPLGPLSRLCWLRVSVDPQISLLLAPLLKVTAHPLYALLSHLVLLFSSYLFVVYMLWSHVLIRLLVNI